MMEIRIYIYIYIYVCAFSFLGGGGEGVNNFCSTNILTTNGEEFFELYIMWLKQFLIYQAKNMI